MKKTDLYLKPGTYIKSSTTQGDVQGISLENFVVSVLNNPTCCPKPPGSPDGMLMTALTLYPTLQTVTDFLGNSSAIQLSTLRLGIRSDSSVTTQTSSVIQATTTNANLVIAPNGTGGIIASVPDGTATGGNARGANAVDLQIIRTNANEVASGTASFLAGSNSKATGVNSVAIGGSCYSTASFAFSSGSGSQATGQYSFASGAFSQASGLLSVAMVQSVASGQYAISLGNNNTASSNNSTVSGGQSNTASTSTHATVVGGQGNTASGQHSVVGGRGNTASNQYSIALGAFHSSSGNSSVAIGNGVTSSGLSSVGIGSALYPSGDYSTVFGYRSKTYLYGQLSNGNGYFSSDGDSMQSLLTARKLDTLTTAATTVLSLDGTGTTNLIIPNGNNRAWNVQIDTIAVVTAITGTATGVSVGHCYSETKQLLFKRIGGTSSIVGTVDTSAIKSDSGMATALLTITAGASQEMALTFTAPTFAGGGSVTCRVVCKLMLTEVAY